jgi:hypothetical protein
MIREKNSNYKVKVKNNKIARLLVIIFLGGMITYSLSTISQSSTVKQNIEISADDFVYNRAQDIANSMADILLMQISDDATFKVNTLAKENFFGGKATYIVEDNFFENDSLIQIKVTAIYNDSKTIITTDINRETKQKEGINVSYQYE